MEYFLLIVPKNEDHSNLTPDELQYNHRQYDIVVAILEQMNIPVEVQSYYIVPKNGIQGIILKGDLATLTYIANELHLFVESVELDSKPE